MAFSAMLAFLSCLACLVSGLVEGIAEPCDSLNDCKDESQDPTAFLMFLQTRQQLLKQAVDHDVSVKPWNNHLYFVGVRHKAGSQVLRNIMRKTFDTLGANCSCRVPENGPDASIITTIGSTHLEGGKMVPNVCSQEPDCNIHWHNCNLDGTALTEHRGLASKKGIPLRSVHIIRDPLQMVASAYCYHHAGNEMPGSPFAPSNIMELNADEGVPLVAAAMLPVSQAMASAHAVHNISDDYVLRYENMTRSSADFDSGVAGMFDFLFENMITANMREQIEAVARTEDLNSPLYDGFGIHYKW
jgi:hypothetical protein